MFLLIPFYAKNIQRNLFFTKNRQINTSVGMLDNTCDPHIEIMKYDPVQSPYYKQ